MEAAPPPVLEDPPARDWSLLPPDALSLVFARVGVVDVLMGAGLVCHSWLHAAKLPDVWHVVDMQNVDVKLCCDDPGEVLFRDHWIPHYKYLDVLGAMMKAAVDRSGGQLRVFAGDEFVTNELIQYIVERSPLLTTLRLVSCDDKGFGERLAGVIIESPLSELRSLELVRVDISVGELITVLENCPALEVVKVSNCQVWKVEYTWRAQFSGIKSPLSELRSLEFDSIDISVGELTTVLENCPALEVVKVSYCSGFYNEDEHALRAQFPWIKSLTIIEEPDEVDDDFDYDFEIREGDDDIPYYGMGFE